MTITRIGTVLTALAGLGFAIAGYRGFQRGQVEYRDWVAAAGELVGARSTFDATVGYQYFPKVRFAPAGQPEREAEVIFPTDRSHDRGPAAVFYDRSDPRRVALDYSVRQRRDSGRNGMLGGGFFFVVGLLGLIADLRRRRPRRPAESRRARSSRPAAE